MLRMNSFYLIIPATDRTEPLLPASPGVEGVETVSESFLHFPSPFSLSLSFEVKMSRCSPEKGQGNADTSCTIERRLQTGSGPVGLVLHGAV